MCTLNLQAQAIKGYAAYEGYAAAHEVAKKLLRTQFGGRKPGHVEVNLAPCAKALFPSPAVARQFEASIASELAH